MQAFLERFVWRLNRATCSNADGGAFAVLANWKKVVRRESWIWGSDQQHAFTTLKAAITAALILAFLDTSVPFWVKADSSDFVIHNHQSISIENDTCSKGFIILRISHGKSSGHLVHELPKSGKRNLYSIRPIVVAKPSLIHCNRLGQ